MTARDRLIMTLAVHESNIAAMTPVADDILNAHARELAEKIRNSPELWSLTDGHMYDCEAAADLIDPEVES